MTVAERWALVQRVVPWIERCLMRAGFPVEDREDARQEVYLRLFELAERYDPSKGALTTWVGWQIRGIVNNVRRRERLFGPCNNYSRPAMRVDIASDDEPLQLRRRSAWDNGVATVSNRNVVSLVAPEDDMVERIDADLVPPRVAVALGRIPERESIAVVGSIAHGRRLEDVGRDLGVSRERVRQLKVQGLQRIREAIRV